MSFLVSITCCISLYSIRSISSPGACGLYFHKLCSCFVESAADLRMIIQNFKKDFSFCEEQRKILCKRGMALNSDESLRDILDLVDMIHGEVKTNCFAFGSFLFRNDFCTVEKRSMLKFKLIFQLPA